MATQGHLAQLRAELGDQPPSGSATYYDESFINKIIITIVNNHFVYMVPCLLN